MNKITYGISESIVPKPSNENFQLHNHDDYEIYMFIEGDAKYVVEGNTYDLEPYDIIIIRKHEMHRVFHNSCTNYRRIVLWVAPDFFVQNNCTEYEKQFISDSAGTGNKINAELVHSSGLYNALLRIKKYSSDFSNIYTPITDAIVTECLYLINNITSFSNANTSNTQLREVITYINRHYTDNISLDELERKFFISKYHLCRIFKKATGLTVHKYITHKRITKVCELNSDGKSLSEAVALSGFGDYSSFYRAYYNEYGIPPRNNLSL